MIRLTKEFAFESAHALAGYDGKCREIHGHSYRLFVTVAGTPSEREDDPKRGMVMDFGDLKRIVGSEIVDRLDHSFVMRRTPESERIASTLGGEFRNVILVDYQPTCENMLCDFAARLACGTARYRASALAAPARNGDVVCGVVCRGE